MKDDLKSVGHSHAHEESAGGNTAQSRSAFKAAPAAAINRDLRNGGSEMESPDCDLCG